MSTERNTLIRQCIRNVLFFSSFDGSNVMQIEQGVRVQGERDGVVPEITHEEVYEVIVQLLREAVRAWEDQPK